MTWLIDWLINWLIELLSDWLIGWFIDWLINVMLDWLIYWLITFQLKERMIVKDQFWRPSSTGCWFRWHAFSKKIVMCAESIRKFENSVLFFFAENWNLRVEAAKILTMYWFFSFSSFLRKSSIQYFINSNFWNLYYTLKNTGDVSP